METISDILRGKSNSRLLTIDQRETTLAATHKMNDHSVGALIVTDGDRMIGIFSERDLLRRVVGLHRNPATVRVRDVMTTDVICCTPDTTIDEARCVLKERRIRHLPVQNAEGEVVGMISMGDLNAYCVDHQEVELHYLHEYLHGRV